VHTLKLGSPNPKASTLLIFDRDGTLNIDRGYSFNSEEIELTPFARCIQKIFEEYEVMAAIASNQSGIARDFFGVKEFDSFTESLVNTIDPKRESFFLAVACPHLPEQNCDCRKPKSEMLRRITEEIEFTQVIMIGNSESDRQTALNFSIQYLDCNGSTACKELQDWVRSRCDSK
jgi:D-glycero-D-manno-heptose 1,7-bisphosphate phosphatase